MFNSADICPERYKLRPFSTVRQTFVFSVIKISSNHHAKAIAHVTLFCFFLIIAVLNVTVNSYLFTLYVLLHLFVFDILILICKANKRKKSQILNFIECKARKAATCKYQTNFVNVRHYSTQCFILFPPEKMSIHVFVVAAFRFLIRILLSSS